MMNTLPHYLEILNSLEIDHISPGLERIRHAAEKLNLFPWNIPTITVGGTNGKGSCVELLENIFLNSGYKTGSYISPHLISFNERIRLQNKPIAEEQLAKIFEKILPLRKEIALSYFEFTTLAALLIFKEALLDVVILEVGLGGRLDAVNIIDADLAIITSIGLDHCEWLGNTREQIAYEKLGIARTNKPLICGDLNPPSNIKTFCQQNNIPLLQIKEHFDYQENIENNTWQWHCQHHVLTELPMPKILINNAATVLTAIHYLNLKKKLLEKKQIGDAYPQQLDFRDEVKQNNLAHLPENLSHENKICHQPESLSLRKTVDLTEKNISTEAIKAALINAAQPGRLQQEMIEGKTVILDVSHNVDAVMQLHNYIQKHFPNQKGIAVFGALQDKDIDTIFEIMRTRFCAWYLASLESNRSYRQAELHKHAAHQSLPHYTVYSNIEEAFATAITNKTHHADYWVVFGSFYAVAPILKKYSHSFIST